MAEQTARFGLQALQAGDNLSVNGYKFVDSDRHQIDRLLEIGAEQHIHTGASADAVDPSVGPELTMSPTGGSIPSGRRVYYKYALVDAYGNESAASPEVYVDTAIEVISPGSPSLSSAASGGTLSAGNYHYVLSAYANVSTSETRALNRSYIRTNASSNTNVNTLTLPSLPAGADGFNVYVRTPGSFRFHHLATVDMTVATPPATYEHDGSAEPDCNRTTPTKNTTNGTGKITVQIPGATPTVPDGYTWKIYRTFTSGEWDTSELTWVVEETSEGSGIITPTFEDLGAGTQSGKPPEVSQLVGTPSKIELSNAAEITGVLPTGMLVVPFQVTFFEAGIIDDVRTGEVQWPCEFDKAQILHARVTTGDGYAPSGSDVIVDLLRFGTNDATQTWTSMYSDDLIRPRVPVGEEMGTIAVPDVDYEYVLTRGDRMRIDVVSADGGATPTAEDLTVTIFMLVRSESAATSFTFADES